MKKEMPPVPLVSCDVDNLMNGMSTLSRRYIWPLALRDSWRCPACTQVGVAVRGISQAYLHAREVVKLMVMHITTSLESAHTVSATFPNRQTIRPSGQTYKIGPGPFCDYFQNVPRQRPISAGSKVFILYLSCHYKIIVISDYLKK